ncbi:hypothetical protein CEP51_009240 [Fusarium floridanum]|uniref:C2H2-type domain-containing protein n=1 Tax=Fusarium floridanum TaxID=1325733 RepID=A0A428RIB4_9HYPO|nr:hypothetical protein CEP51_009240 [Fusarium floridanum]
MDSYYQHSSAYHQQPSSTTDPTQPMDETYQYSYQYSSSSTMETPRWSGYYTYQPSSSAPEEPPRSTSPSLHGYDDSSPSTAARPRTLAESSQNTNNPGIYCLHHGCTSEPFKREADLQRHYRNTHNPDSTKEANHRDDTSSQNPEIHHCLHPGCTAKPFRRAADLQRHYKYTHSPDSNEAYYCDYIRCSRSQEPFRRRDHFRDHLREYHREDIQKRGEVVVNEEGQEERRSASSWWRCARCLVRVSGSQDDSKCPHCKTSRESVGQKKRRVH